MNRPSPTKPLFDVPIKRPNLAVFPRPRFWSKVHSSFDGMWMVQPLGLWAVGLQVPAASYGTSGSIPVGGRFVVLDMRDLNDIHVEGSVGLAAEGSNGVHFLNENLGCTIFVNGVRFFDLTNKAAPFSVGVGTVLGTSITGLYPGFGNLFFVGTHLTVSVVDFTNPAAPTSASVPSPPDTDMTDRQALAYNASTELLYTFGGGTFGFPSSPGSIAIVDVSDPTAPTKVNVIYGRPLYSGVRSALLWDSNTIIAQTTTFGMLLIIDISTPLEPEIVNAFEYYPLATMGNLDGRIIGRRDNDLLITNGILNHRTQIWRVDCSDLGDLRVVDNFTGDFDDRSSPIVAGQPAREAHQVSGGRLWNGLYPVFSIPAMDTVSVIDI